MKKISIIFILFFLSCSCYAQEILLNQTIDSVKRKFPDIDFMLEVTTKGVPYLEADSADKTVCYFFENKKCTWMSIRFKNWEAFEKFQENLVITANVKQVDAENWVMPFKGSFIYIRQVMLDNYMNVYYSQTQTSN